MVVTFPVPGQQMIIQNVHHHPGVVSLLRHQAALTLPKHRVRIREAVNLAVQ